MNGNQIRKGAPDAIQEFVESDGGRVPAEVDAAVQRVAPAAARRWWSPATTSCWA